MWSRSLGGMRLRAKSLRLAVGRAVRRSVRMRTPARGFAARPAEESIQNEASKGFHGQMAYWLYGCCGMVFGMVALGGVTRLTGSGLSMVEWKPTGILPPTSESGWLEEFEKYQEFPEYQKHNDELSLTDFKWIWFMEWGHRMAGRATGIVFALPLAYFAARRAIPPRLYARFATLLFLGGSQGLIGWWMVRSGLDGGQKYGGEGRVSPYRLATHLSMAFILYATLFNTAIGLHTVHKASRLTPAMRAEAEAVLAKIPKNFKKASVAVASLIGLTAFSGAFVAGNHAGMVYDEFPKMGGQWIPDDIVNPYLTPAWRNIFEHDTMVQWNHRVLAMSTLGSVLGLYIASRRLPVILPLPARIASNALLGMSGIQVTLGISTLLMHVPVPLASAHQMGSLTLLTIAMWFAHTLRPLPVTVAASVISATAAAAATSAAAASASGGAAA